LNLGRDAEDSAYYQNPTVLKARKKIGLDEKQPT